VSFLENEKMSNVKFRLCNTDIDSHLEGAIKLHPMGENFRQHSDQVYVALEHDTVIAIAAIKGKSIAFYGDSGANGRTAETLVRIALSSLQLNPSVLELLQANRVGDLKATIEINKRLRKFIQTCVRRFTRTDDDVVAQMVASQAVRQALPECPSTSLDELVGWTAKQVRQSINEQRKERKAIIA